VETDWVEEAKLTASDAEVYGSFGYEVAIHQNLIAVFGLRGFKVYVFRRAGTSWVELHKIAGGAVAIDCRHVLAGPHVFTISGDCNENGRADACEAPGDFDGDDDVDLVNFGQLHDCMTAPIPGALGPGCCFFDLELDDDVDLRDFRLFQLAFSGSPPTRGGATPGGD
jgi:hypothetical protein